MAEEKNNSYKFKGKVVEIPEPKKGVSVSGEWMLQAIIVEDEETQKKYSFEIFGKDKCEAFDIHVGDNVVLSFSLHSSFYNGRYYSTCRVWKCYKQGGRVKKDVPEELYDKGNSNPPSSTQPMSTDDLPF